MTPTLRSALFASLSVSFSLSAAQAADVMKPGLWEIKSSNQMEGMKMPAMPALSPEQQAQMKAMGIKMPTMSGQGMEVTVRHCVTPEQAKTGVPPQPKDRGQCKQANATRSGNKVNWSIECTGEHAASGHGTVTFNSPESYSGESTMTVKESRMGPMTMQQQFSGKWLSVSCEGK
jgi:hypothetical protein